MCVDDKLDGLGRELFDLLNEDAGSGRLGVGVDDEDGVVEDDNRGVAIDFVGGLGNGGVDSVCDRLDVEQSSARLEAGRKRKRIATSTRFMKIAPGSAEMRLERTTQCSRLRCDISWTYCRQISPWGYVKVARQNEAAGAADAAA